MNKIIAAQPALHVAGDGKTGQSHVGLGRSGSVFPLRWTRGVDGCKTRQGKQGKQPRQPQNS